MYEDIKIKSILKNVTFELKTCRLRPQINVVSLIKSLLFVQLLLATSQQKFF